ncbi:MAG: hypothetical protein H7281_13815 [Bacteriovorax sp.]|nr:hypothetical protein [Bacteriovorax sp.]
MKANNNIPKYVETFFKSCEIDEKLNRYSFFLIRYDGVVLYHNNNLANSLSKSSIGALLGGVWQAARALAAFIPKEESKEGYRLSFDTSSQGVYIVPITVGAEELYLGLIYHDEVNPGFIKNKMREMATSFGEFLEQELTESFGKNQARSNENNDFLFGDITDSEMDRLFAFAKN